LRSATTVRCCSAPPASLIFLGHGSPHLRDLHSFPTRRSSDLLNAICFVRFDIHFFSIVCTLDLVVCHLHTYHYWENRNKINSLRSEEHTSELQSRFDLVCRLLLEKKKNTRPLPS